MKQRIFAFVMFVILSITAISAQTISFKTTSFSYREKNSYGWTNWSNSTSSNLLLTIDIDNDRVTIFSPLTQYYKITEYVSQGYDSDGDYVAKFRFIDQDRDYGTLRLIQRTSSGKSEVYIDFANVMWCYSVIRL